MIRINLLPTTRKPTRTTTSSGSGQAWAVAYLVTVVLWGVALGLFYFAASAKLDEQLRRNQALQTQITRIRSKSARLEEVKAKLEQSKTLEELVAELNRARTGPTRALMEVSKILAVSGGPTIDLAQLEKLRRDNPLAGFNRSWDVRRLWLTSFEEDQRECRISGKGKTNEDVAEFLRRLALSELFDKVTLERTEAVADQDTGLKLIGFELTCKVLY